MLTVGGLGLEGGLGGGGLGGGGPEGHLGGCMCNRVVGVVVVGDICALAPVFC